MTADWAAADNDLADDDLADDDLADDDRADDDLADDDLADDDRADDVLADDDRADDVLADDDGNGTRAARIASCNAAATLMSVPTEPFARTHLPEAGLHTMGLPRPSGAHTLGCPVRLSMH